MSDKDNGGAAFPQSGYGQWAPEGGATLRDYFAIKSLQGLLASCPHDAETREAMSGEIWAFAAYKMADAMLKERAK